MKRKDVVKKWVFSICFISTLCGCVSDGRHISSDYEKKYDVYPIYPIRPYHPIYGPPVRHRPGKPPHKPGDPPGAPPGDSPGKPGKPGHPPGGPGASPENPTKPIRHRPIAESESVFKMPKNTRAKLAPTQSRQINRIRR